jgi:very-short-patch-repair endonuclease
VPARQIVQGQHVTEAKATRAREFRRAMTAPERKLWAALRRSQLLGLHFRRQQIIDGFVADFYCHAAGLVVEIDGPHHADQPDYDAERDRIIAARNLRVLRLTDDEVLRSLPIALQRIVDAIQG